MTHRQSKHDVHISYSKVFQFIFYSFKKLNAFSLTMDNFKQQEHQVFDFDKTNNPRKDVLNSLG